MSEPSLSEPSIGFTAGTDVLEELEDAAGAPDVAAEIESFLGGYSR